MGFLKERIASFGYAFEGIFEVIKSQPNFKIHFLAAIAAIGLGGYFNISTLEWCLIVGCISLVFGAETFNTAIEHLTNLVSPDYHILAKKTKDAAAGAVLFIAIGSAIIGLLIFLPKVVALLT
ncbi:MAG: diacylglycerol kinase family protein [Bacteroidota bacterium]